MTQKALAERLIGLTLYKKQKWYPEGILKNGILQLTKAETLIDKTPVTIDYQHAVIAVKRKKLRIPKELKTDLLTIVRLKIAKIIRHAKLN